MSMDRQIKKKRFTPKRIIGFGLGGLFFVVVIYNLVFGDRSSKLNVEIEKITISTVSMGPFVEFIPVTGTVLPIKTVYLDAIEGGRVEKKIIEAGTFGKEGDPILQLSNTNLLLDIMFREAEFFEQQNNLRNTRLEMERYRLALKQQMVEIDYQIKQLKRRYGRGTELRNRNLISQEEYDQLKDEYEYNIKRRDLALVTYEQDSVFRKVQIGQLEASIDRMQSNLGIVKKKLDNLVVKAPITGQLTSLNAEVGESKSPGQRLGQVDVLDGFKVRASPDEHYLARITLGLPARFDFAGGTYELITKKIFPEIRDGRFDIDLEFVGVEPKGIRRGQTVHIRLDLGDLDEATVLLNRGGFWQKTGGQWVYLVDKSGEFATKRMIRLGRQNTQVYEVLAGLEPGEKVITSTYDSFGDIDKLILK